MVTSEERQKVLRMVEAGQITAEEATQLLGALGKQESRKTQMVDQDSRWLRVRVTDLEGERASVNVNLPLSLVNVGLRLGARFVPEIEGMEYEELVQALREGASGKIVDVVDEEEGKRVEVYVD